MIKEILLLGNPALYKAGKPLEEGEINRLKPIVDDLHDTLMEFKRKYGAGRAIAAPQIGILKRIVYMYIDSPVVFINPVIEYDDSEEMVLLDDCMSFPNLLVKVKRYKRCKIKYKDIDWQDCTMEVEGDLSELLQNMTILMVYWLR